MSAISSLSSNINFAADPTADEAPVVRQGAPGNPFAEVSSEEWLNIILEELSNQDPFEPNDTSATLEQLNSLRSIESDISLQDQLQSLVLQNSIGQAGSLIGRQVEGLSNSGLNVTGIVASVRVVDGDSQLQLESGSTIDFSNITNVSAVEPSPATPGFVSAPNAVANPAATDPNVQAINETLAGLLSGGATVSTNAEDEEAGTAS
ncbi:MAG: flagellar hook capping FlgD N-terminal domain-containing protein [Planctomycetota bacterium]